MDPVVTRFFYIGLVCTIIACVVLLSCFLTGQEATRQTGMAAVTNFTMRKALKQVIEDCGLRHLCVRRELDADRSRQPVQVSFRLARVRGAPTGTVNLPQVGSRIPE